MNPWLTCSNTFHPLAIGQIEDHMDGHVPNDGRTDGCWCEKMFYWPGGWPWWWKFPWVYWGPFMPAVLPPKELPPKELPPKELPPKEIPGLDVKPVPEEPLPKDPQIYKDPLPEKEPLPKDPQIYKDPLPEEPLPKDPQIYKDPLPEKEPNVPIDPRGPRPTIPPPRGRGRT